MEFGQQTDLVNLDQTVPGSPKPQEKTEMDVEMSGSESLQGEKNMECETENQSKTSEDSTSIQEPPEMKKNDKDDSVPDVLNTISDIVDPHLDTSTDPVDDGLIIEIAKKAENEDRMTFCIEKPTEFMIPVTSSGQTSELLVVHPVCAFARPVDMEYALVGENDVGSDLAKEVQLLINEEERALTDNDTVSKAVSNGGQPVGNVPVSEAEGTISSAVEQVVRRSQRVYNSLVGPDTAVKVVAPIPLYRKSSRLSDASLAQVARKMDVQPKQVAALKGKKGKLKSSRNSPLSKADVKTRTPVRLESMNTCNPTSVCQPRSGSSKSSDQKGTKKLPKFLSQYSVKPIVDKKKDVKKTVSRKRSSSVNLQEEESSRSSTPEKSLLKSTSTASLNRKTVSRKGGSPNNLQEKESRSSTPDKPLQKSASTVSLIRKLKMRDGGDVPTPRRSQRIYNSLNGPKEAINVLTPVTRDYRPTNEVVYNSLVGEDNDVKLEIPKIRKRTIKKEKPVTSSKKSKVSTEETEKGGKPIQGYSKFDRVLLTETNPGRPMGIVSEFSQTTDTKTASYSRSRPKRMTKGQQHDETERTKGTAETSSPNVSEVSDASVLVASSYFTTRRGTQTKVVYSTPATLSSSTSAQKRPAMSASVQRNSPGLRRKRLGLAPDQPDSSTLGSSSSATGSERSRRSVSKKVVENAASDLHQVNEPKEENLSTLKKSRSSSKLK